jgi:hypothetical protein
MADEDMYRPPIIVNPSGDIGSSADIDDDFDSAFDEASELEQARRKAQARTPASSPVEAKDAARVGLWAIAAYLAWKGVKAVGGFVLAGPPGAVIGAATP